MKIAYNPKTAVALTAAPSNNDITFDLPGQSIYVKGVKFDGKAYSIFKKYTSATAGGYNGLVPAPSYNDGSTNRFLKEDGTWGVPEGTGFTIVSSTTDGLAPKIGTVAASTVTTQADEWVLTSTKGATPTWRKLPTNAFLNYYRPILVNGTSLLGNNNTALNIAAGTNINLTTDAGKVTINNGLTKLSQLTDDILSGKYLPLTGGTLTGNLNIGSETTVNTPSRYLYLWKGDGTNSHRGLLALSDKGTSLSYWNTTTGKYNSLCLNETGLYFTQDGSANPTLLKIWHERNDGSDSGLDADLLDGKHATDFLPHATASSPQNNDETWINQYAKDHPRSYVYNNSGLEWQYLIGLNSNKSEYGSVLRTSYLNGGTIQIKALISNVWNPWKTVAFTDSNITGNAASATKLQTKRKIWGQYFDGTTDVSGNMTGVGSITASGTIRSVHFYGKQAKGGAQFYFGIRDGLAVGIEPVDADGNWLNNGIQLFQNGNVSIGTVTNSEKLYVNGNVKATSFIGNLDGTYVNKLTGYTKATSASDLIATDTLNIALGKLEYKAGIAYSWYRTITEDDTDEIINKWDEVVDFVNNLEVDLTEEFVTRKTDQTITGKKIFSHNAYGEQLTIHRTQRYSDSMIKFSNNGDGILGYIGIGGSRSESGPFNPYWSNGTNAYKFWHAGNDGADSGLDADLLDGKHATEFFQYRNWNASKDYNTIRSNGLFISNPADNASSINTPHAYSNILSFGTGKSTDNFGAIQISFSNATNLCIRNLWDSNWSQWKQIAFTDSNITGNAASATRLQTPRKIWGNDFDGSADVSGYIRIFDSKGVYQYDKTGSQTLAYFGHDESLPFTHVYNGIGHNSIRLYDNGKVSIPNGSVGIGTTNPVRKFVVSDEGRAGIEISPYASDSHIISFDRSTNTWLPLTIDCTYFGVCVKNPTHKLDVAGGAHFTDKVLIDTTLTDHNASTYNCLVINVANKNKEVTLKNAPGIGFHIKDHSWGGLIFNNGFHFVTGEYSSYLDVKAKAFIKNNSSDSYVLLGGGGHKAISDFLLKSEIANQELSNNLTTITKELTLTQDWMDTGIAYNNLPSNGTYVVQVYVHALASYMWECYWSGVMTWHITSSTSNRTNDEESDEIILHRSGHAYHNTIYLRTKMTKLTSNGGTSEGLKLQIAANKNIGAAYTYTFKFKRII